MSTIGFRLREERERLKLNQTDFGSFGGVQKHSQINYEKGVRRPDTAYLAAIAQMGADVLYIITGQRNENVASTPTELGYLRHCRAFQTKEERDAGLNLLMTLRKALGIRFPHE